MKEFRKYKLRSTKKPAKWTLLSTTVAVWNQKLEPSYCYLSFDSCFIDAVGKKMPQGLSIDNPAFIKVFYSVNQWVISAHYIKSPEVSVVLWVADTQPLWLRFFKIKTL